MAYSTNPDYQLAENFKLSEFISTSTGYENIPNKTHFQFIHAMARLLQSVRNVLDRPIVINSCYRSPKVNAAVGGSRTSYHLTGSAVDLSIMHLPYHALPEFERLLKSFCPREFIKYDTFWHVAYDFNHLGSGDHPVDTYEMCYPDLREPLITEGDF